VTSKAEFLGKLTIFQALEPEELEALAAITDEYQFENGAPIAYQRDVANSLYIVRSGRLYAQRLDTAGIVRHSHDYLPGDYFQDNWLFEPEVHPETVRASGSGRVLIIPSDKFLSFLERNGIPVDVLVLSSKGEKEAHQSRVALPNRRAQSLRLLPDELVKFDERRSRWLLVVREILPLFLTFAVPIAANVLLRRVLSGHWLNIVLPLVLFIVFGFWAFFIFLDWFNDFFLVTTKHLVRSEFDLRTFAAKINKTPIDQVQSVEVEKPGLMATVFNIGTARITTASQAGTIYFDFIDDPLAVKNAINESRELVRALDAGRVQATMRQSLEGHFQAPSPLQKISETTDAAVTIELTGWEAFRENWRRTFGYRVEEGRVITYRKHAFVLLRQNWWLILLVLAALVALVLVPNVTFFLGVLVAFLVMLGWLVWRIEDWRNDTFQVNDRYVIDIDRKPFGFGESRKQTELGNVQNVNADKPNILATIFNYGNVLIETAGAAANINFESVADPNQVQSDIFQRRDEFRQRQRVQEGERQRKEYAVLLDVYQQAVEQGRIPRRTPTDSM
jgi:CRP-like cAMP-binding protein